MGRAGGEDMDRAGGEDIGRRKQTEMSNDGRKMEAGSKRADLEDGPEQKSCRSDPPGRHCDEGGATEVALSGPDRLLITN